MLRHYNSLSVRRIYMSKHQEKPPPAVEFAPLASRFERRFLLGIGTASLVGVGANFGGITSFLLGFSPQTGRHLKLDVLYPIGGYTRCIDTNQGFEFIYPVNWVGDETVLYRAAGKAESERSLDPPPLTLSRRRNVNEPVVAFGPPGSTGELNVSVIVSPISPQFSMEALGGGQEVGEAVVGTVASRRGVKGTLIDWRLREDAVKYYEVEFRVESPSFGRHNVAVCCVRNATLYTLIAQAPESAWPSLKSHLYAIAHSFTLT
uniref:Photosystem II reaction center PsbP family protein n=1 Tax=Monsonia emarginata TaxID=28966 RepID=A0A0F7H042_9ROSI